MHFHELIDEKTAVRMEGLLFRLGMWWRIFYGLIRFLSGLALLRMIGTPLSDIFFRIMRTELVEDPSDRFVQVVGHALHQHSYEVTFFLAFYFIFWGVVDIWLSISLLRHQTWAFPVSLVLITVFVIYGIFRFFHTHSLVLLVVILVDIVLIRLIWQEYQRMRHKLVISESQN